MQPTRRGFLSGFGSIDFGRHHALSLAGGMFVPRSRWVYFAMIVNWSDNEGGTVNDEITRFATTWGQIFRLLQQAFTTC